MFRTDPKSLHATFFQMAVQALGAAWLVLLATGLIVASAAAGRRGVKHLKRGGN